MSRESLIHSNLKINIHLKAARDKKGMDENCGAIPTRKMLSAVSKALHTRLDDSSFVYFDIFFRSRSRREELLGKCSDRDYKLNQPALCIDGDRSKALYDPHA